MNPVDPYTGSSLDLEFFGPFWQLSLFKVVSKYYLYLKLSQKTKLKKRNHQYLKRTLPAGCTRTDLSIKGQTQQMTR